jgi:hypothetical protein
MFVHLMQSTRGFFEGLKKMFFLYTINCNIIITVFFHIFDQLDSQLILDVRNEI